MVRLGQVDNGQLPVTERNAYRRIYPGPVVVGTTVDEAMSHRLRQFMELFGGPPTRWVDEPCQPAHLRYRGREGCGGWQRPTSWRSPHVPMREGVTACVQV